jgi:hypothetical protein
MTCKENTTSMVSLGLADSLLREQCVVVAATYQRMAVITQQLLI